ncbi:aminotransferase class IV, partial [Bacillus velezensis]|uniref:aminotransferase class IV n=1 Tax=Bacillus velezensis TaxID=492670 RepID=UPI00201C217A
NTPEQGLRVKSHHYGNNVLGRFEMLSLPQQEGFFLTEQGYAAEGLTSNVFWVNNDILYTPSLETGILPG